MSGTKSNIQQGPGRAGGGGVIGQASARRGSLAELAASSQTSVRLPSISRKSSLNASSK